MRECSLGRAKAVLAVLAPQLAHKTEMRTKSRNTAEDKLAELQQKYALLEDDRKAHYEASQWTIKQNKETMLLAKSENKKLRNNLAKVRSAVSKGDPNEAEHRNLVGHARVLRKRYDECHTDVTKLSRELEKLRDNTKDLQRDAVRPTDEDSSEMRYIRLLENRLDKALVKDNEAHSIRKTYEQIVLKLREDRVSFDNQLGMIEKTLRDREVDLGELVLMSHDANHAREVAKLELHSIEDQVATERNLRTRELKERKQQMKAKKELHAKIRKREKEKYEAIQKESEMVYSDLKAAKQVKAKQKKQDEIMTAKVTTYQEAFQKIKEATGIYEVNELVQKVMNQDETKSNLRQLVKENQAKVDQKLEEKALLKSRLEEMKYTGSLSGDNHKVADQFEKILQTEEEQCLLMREQFEQSAKLLIEIKTGIMHLFEKLGEVKISKDDNLLQTQLNATLLDAIENDTISEMMILVEAKMMKALEYVQDDEAAKASITTQDLPDPGPGNMRVFIGVEGKNDDSDNSDNDSLLDRDILKSNSKKFELRKARKLSTRKGSKG